MEFYQKAAEKIPAFHQILEALQSGNTPALAVGLSTIHKTHFAYALSKTLEKQLLLITEDEQTARRIADDLNVMQCNPLEQDEDVVPVFAGFYPAREFAFHKIDGASNEYQQQRIGLLSRLQSGDCRIVTASMEAVMQYTIPPDQLISRSFVISANGSYVLDDLTARLVKAGYVRRAQVDGVAQFSLRGGILDLFPCDQQNPVRIEFWDEEVDQMSFFDITTQRRTERMEEVRIVPAVEVLFDSAKNLSEKLKALLSKTRATKAKETIQNDLARLEAEPELLSLDKFLPLAYEKPATLLDYFTDSVVIVSEYTTIKERVKSYLWQHHEDLKTLLEEGTITKGEDTFIADFGTIQHQLDRFPLVYADTFAHSSADLKLKRMITLNPLQTSGWSGELKLLCEDVVPFLAQGYTAAVLAGTKKAAMVLAEDLRREGVAADYVSDVNDLKPSRLYVLSNTLSSGFEYPDAKLILITLLKHTVTSKRRGRFKKGKALESLADLQKGDYVVHATHGIGVFAGIEKLELQGIIKDYIKINYAGTDTLHIPVTQLDLVTKYVGPKEDKGVKLNKLNNAEWTKTKQRVKAAVDEMADELIRLYAERAKVKGFAFSPDTVWQKEFEDRFEYQETDDQLRSVAEIKADMESTVPMDRLLCGDVGFGKTEVAVRAAFKCVMDSKQCALLCPTTILAWQHYQSITKRMGHFPVTVELLSRFRTPKQIKETLYHLQTGRVDIVIGTHRLIQKDVRFKDLGLAIVDEEQRFGVAHKERFKEIFRNVDMLSLSATPIPRTLNMALTGIRDMSTIDEPPQDRHPVQTYVLEHDSGIIAEAIRKEMRRDGQVYYIHNRIESIELCAGKIAAAVPEAQIGIAHGKMSEEELSVVWKQLLEHEIDVLVCTTLIETGVDVPNCNTLIIEDADYMGLSQLYQLRGRIGRSNRRAYAYFTFRRGKALSEIATKRLNAIREFTKFGSGFNIAMRDLEIRGAGNILGTRQHGHMEAVGYDMYLKMLSDAVLEKQGGATKPAVSECIIDIKANAHIPEDYMDDMLQRIEVYRKIAGVKTYEDSIDVVDELIDRFGEPPQSVKSLIDVALLRNILAENGFVEINQRVNTLLLYPATLNMEVAGKIIRALKSRVAVNAGQKPYIAVKLGKDNSPLTTLREIADSLLVK